MSYMTAEEYYKYLFQIQSSNPPTKAFLSAAETPYTIDLKTRKIEGPEFLSVSKDHKSETIYFIIDRYADYMDLADTVCIIHYTHLKTNKSYLYAVPFYDIFSYNTDTQKKIVFPWCIDGTATELAGTVRYSISFFKVDHEAKKFLYNLNTLPTEGKVLYGMDVAIDPDDPDYESFVGITPTKYEELLYKITQLDRDSVLYWEED